MFFFVCLIISSKYAVSLSFIACSHSFNNFQIVLRKVKNDNSLSDMTAGVRSYEQLPPVPHGMTAITNYPMLTHTVSHPVPIYM